MSSESSYKLKKGREVANQKNLQEYVETLKSQLEEEHDQKEALSVERAKLKVCWEMTLEELVSTRNELSEKIKHLESQLTKQLKRKKLLQRLLDEYGRNMEEMRLLIDHIIERPKYVPAQNAEDTALIKAFAEEPK